MPVQVPVLQRLEPKAPDTVGRIDAQAPNFAKSLGQTFNAVGDAISTAADYAFKIEGQAADTAKNAAVNEFDIWAKKKLYGDSATNTLGLVHAKGDPTDAYNVFDVEAEAKLEEIASNSGKGYGAKTAAKIRQGLSDKFTSIYDTRLTQYGKQYADYEQRTTDASVELTKRAVIDSLGYVKADEPSTLAPFNQNLSDIRDLRISQAIKIGTAVPDPQGTYEHIDDNGNKVKLRLNPSVQNEIATDVSEGTYNAIDNLIASDTANSLSSAKMMLDKYSTFIDPHKLPKLTETYEKAHVEQQAYDALKKLDGKNYVEQKKILKGLSGDPKVKQKASELLDAQERYKINEQNRDSTDAFEQLSISIQKKMQSEQPYDSTVQMENDKSTGFRKLISRITDEKQYKAIYALIDGGKPKESDDKVKSDLFEKLRKNEFYGMPYPKLAEAQVGLNKQDSKMFDSQWVKQNTDTDAAERSRTNFAADEFHRLWQEMGLGRNDYRGNLTKSSMKERNEYETKLREQIDKLPKNTGTAEITTGTRNFVSDAAVQLKKKKEGDGFFSRMKRRLGIGGPAPDPDEAPPTLRKGGATGSFGPPENTTEVAPPTSAFKKMTPKQQVDAVRLFKEINKRPPANAAELNEFIQKGGQ